jgi:hypothetical protein
MEKTSPHKLFHLMSLAVALSILLAGCAGQQVAGVATLAPPSPVPTDTPERTATRTPTPAPTDTPVPTATRTPTATPNRTATQAVKQTATQAAVDARVSAELEKLGLDPSLGHVTWVMEQPYELDGSGYATGWYQSIEELGVLKDFVVQTEITWDTSGALAGCGYIFRGPEDWDTDIGDFYEFEIIRLQFAPAWFIHYFKDGRWEYALPGQNGVSSANLEDEKFNRNVVTLDVRGDTFTVYINGVKERSIQNNKIGEGRLAFVVVQNSGTSYCKFEKGWVWAYDE